MKKSILFTAIVLICGILSFWWINTPHPSMSLEKALKDRNEGELQKYAKMDSVRAIMALVDLYAGIGKDSSFCYEPEDSVQAIKLLKKAASLNEPYAYTLLGICYDYGYMLPQDSVKCICFLRKAAEMYEPRALHNLALKYEEGYGSLIPKDKDIAISYWEVCIDCSGYKYAFAKLAWYYCYDDEHENYSKAYKLFNEAVAHGDSSALFDIAQCHFYGWGVEQNYGEALRTYEKSANWGSTSAMVNLGYMYSLGFGVAKDEIKSLEWTHKAANQGEVVAQYNMGIDYYYGEGVKQDYRLAFEWFSKAAQKGYIGAMNMLSSCYRMEEEQMLTRTWQNNGRIKH